MGENQNFNKYLFWAVIAILLILSYLVVKPFLIALISAFILAYLVKPVYNRIAPKIGKSFAGIVSVVIVVIAVVVPFLLVVGELARQLLDSLNKGSLSSIVTKISSLPLLDSFNFQTNDLVDKVFSFVFSLTSSLVSNLPNLIISIAVVLLGIYYILQNWNFLVSRMKSYIPFKNKDKLMKDMGRATNRIVYGYAFIALIEFVISFIGFYLSGVKYFILLPALIAILAFVPAAGPMLVWLPLAVYYFISGNIFTGVGVAIVGVIISVGMDNLIAPYILGRASNIHPFIMFIGVIGGISIFGIFGFIIGPLILAYTLEILEEVRSGVS